MLRAARAAAVAAATVAVSAAAIAPAGAQPLPTVASAGLCADQFVLALADPDQIVAVSYQATGPLSVFADQARAYAETRGTAEELLYLAPDVVVLPAWGMGRTGELLERFGVTVVHVPIANTFEEVRAATRTVAAAIGRTTAGEQLIAAMDARLAAVADRPGEPPVVAYVRPGGGSAGPGTFVDAVLQAARARNLAAELGQPGWGRLDLETLLTHEPDALVVSFFETAYPSLMTAFSRHPVFLETAADTPVIAVPGRYWICGSPMLADAVEVVARGLDRLTPQSGTGG